jgi:hypothetical protein
MNLSDDSRIWIFGISPSLDDAAGAKLLARVDDFLARWAAHGEPITSGRDLIEGAFLVIGVDRRSETSGCSIDRMFGLLQQIERELAVKILDPDRIFYRGGDARVHAMTRAEFAEKADPHTAVFDVLAERLGEVTSGRWERAAKDSWHNVLLDRRLSAGRSD